MKSILEQVYGVELSSQKIELGKVEDIKKLLDKGEQQLKEAKDKIQGIKKELSRALIIVNQNVPSQAKSTLKIADELGAESLSKELKSIISNAERLSKEFMPLYKSI